MQSKLNLLLFALAPDFGGRIRSGLRAGGRSMDGKETFLALRTNLKWGDVNAVSKISLTNLFAATADVFIITPHGRIRIRTTPAG
jgi:hypothetical protein